MSDVLIPPAASPVAVASRLLGVHGDDPSWLDRFAEALDERRAGHELDRILRVWGLSRTEAGALFGVSRQAVAKWIGHGPPSDRVRPVADLAAATDLLVHHLKRERIPAVVRRSAPGLGGRSLLDLVAAGESARALELTRAMFAFGDAHA